MPPLPWVLLERATPERPTLTMQLAKAATLRSSADVGEQISWDGDLGHLEGDIATVIHYPRADLDQLFLQVRQRPSLRLDISNGFSSTV